MADDSKKQVHEPEEAKKTAEKELKEAESKLDRAQANKPGGLSNWLLSHQLRVEREVKWREHVREAEEAKSAAEKKLKDAESNLVKVQAPMPLWWWSRLRAWCNETIEPTKPRWTYLIAPFLGCMAPFATLITVLVVVGQIYSNEIHFQVEQSEKQFKDVQDRLASADEKTRAAAALQLAELAITSYPQLHIYGALPFDKQNYPFFPRAAQQFAIALNSEEKASVRTAIKGGVKVLAEFAKDKDKGHDILLADMVNKFADANRTAKNRFITAMAEWNTAEQNSKANQGASASMTDAQIAFLAGVTHFCKEDKNTQSALRTLLDEGQEKGEKGKVTTLYSREKYAYDVVRTKEVNIDRKAREAADAKLLPALRVASEQLGDTRDALATGLKLLSLPSEVYEFQAKIDEETKAVESATDEKVRDTAQKKLTIEVEHLQEALPKTRQAAALQLSDCFLAGTDFHEAKLIGVDFRYATLTGADLRFAALTGAYIQYAALTGANLFDTTLTGADLTHTTLTGADLTDATLTATDLHHATLTGAKILNSKLDQARNIPETWEQADYRNTFGKEVLAYKKKIESAYKQQQRKH